MIIIVSSISIITFQTNIDEINVHAQSIEITVEITRFTNPIGYREVRTDKPIYNIGEVVHISGSAEFISGLTTTYAPDVGLIVEIQIFNPNNDLIHMGTSDKNAAQGNNFTYNYTIESSDLPGKYTIHARFSYFTIDGSTDYIEGEANFNIIKASTFKYSIPELRTTPPVTNIFNLLQPPR